MLNLLRAGGRARSPLGIRGRFLALGITGAVSIASLGGGALYMNLRVRNAVEAEKAASELANVSSRLSAQRDELRGDVYKSVWSVRNSAEFTEDTKRFRANLDALRERAEASDIDLKVKENVGFVLDRAEAFIKATQNVMDRDGGRALDLRPLLAKFETSYGIFRDALEKLVTGLEENREASTEDLEAAVVFSTLFVTVLGVVCFVTLSVIGESSRRRIGTGVASIKDSMRRISEGDLTARVDDDEGDEITEIASSANRVAEVFEAALRRVRDRAADVFTASRKIHTSASELGVVIESATEVSTSLAASTTTISSMGRQISDAAGVLGKSLHSVGESAAAVSTVAEEAVGHAAAAREEMGRLDAAGKGINEMVDVINTIAEQTHILAINASIEAARAGDAGRGFAVVADEVRNLSAATAKATAEIKRRAQAVQEGNDAARSALLKIVETIEGIAARQSAVVDDVARQSRATDEISKGIGELHGAASKVAEGARTAATQSEAIRERRELLLAYADELSQLVGLAEVLLNEFKLLEK